jgi:hypothetical protein
MDNVEEAATTTPQGQVDAVTEMPDTSSGETPQNDASGVEPTETPKGESQEVKEEGFKIPEKFQGKSAEEIAQSYVELESQNKKVEMERSDLEKLFVEKETDSTKVDDAPTDTPAISEDVNTALKDLEPQLAKSVANMLAKPLAKLEVQDMLNKHGSAFTQKAKEVKALQEHNPSLSMEDAFKIISFDNVKRTSHTQGVNEANANAEAKQKAQVETARPSGIKPVGIDEAIADKDVGAAEIADALQSSTGDDYSEFKRISDERSGKV